MKIPKVFHRIWFGTHKMPQEFVEYGEMWQEFHPDWEMKLWNEHNLPVLNCKKQLWQAKNFAEMSDILRYEILFMFGGVYLDTDFEPLRNIEPLIFEDECFSASECDPLISIGIMGCTPGHEVFQRAVERMPFDFPRAQDTALNTGPGYLTKIVDEYKLRDKIKVYGVHQFYPYGFTSKCPDNYHELFLSKGGWAVHHWTGSWKGRVKRKFDV